MINATIGAVTEYRTRNDLLVAMLLVFSALFGAAVFSYTTYPLGEYFSTTDSWHHIATLRALAEDLLQPGNPFVASDEPTRSFTPHYVLIAALGGAVGMNDPYSLLAIAAVTTSALTPLALVYFLRGYTNSWSAVAGGTFIFFFLWGYPPAYTGFTNIRTLLMASGYPSAFAFMLGLVWIGYQLRLQRRQQHSISCFAALAGLTGVVLLVHQLTWGFFVGFSSLLAVFHSRSWRQATVPIGSILAGSVAATAWPYFNVFDVFRSVGGADWSGASFFSEPVKILLIAGPALAGVYTCFWQGLRRERLEIVIGTVALTAVYIIGHFALHNPVAHRFFGFSVVFMQLSVWLFSVDHPSHVLSRAVRNWYFVSLLVMFHAAIFMFQAFGPRIMESVPSLRPYVGFPPPVTRLRDTAAAVAARVPRGALTAASDAVVYPLAASGIRLLSIPRGEPYIRDLPARQQASTLIFDESKTDEERLATLARLRIGFIVADEQADSTFVSGFASRHAVEKYRSGTMVLFAVDRTMVAEPKGTQ